MTQTTQYSCYGFLLFVALPQCFGGKGVSFPADSTLPSPAPSRSVSFWLMYKIGQSIPPYLQGQNGQPSIRGVRLQDKKGGKSLVWGPPHRRASSPTQMLPDTTPSTGPDLVDPSGYEPVVVHSQPQEPPHLLLGLGTRAGCDGCCSLHLWVHLSAPKVVPQILDLPLFSCLPLLQVGSMRCWKVAGALNKSNGSVTNWYNPYRVEKAIFFLDSADKGICQ